MNQYGKTAIYSLRIEDCSNKSEENVSLKGMYRKNERGV